MENANKKLHQLICRDTLEWLYENGDSRITIGYPRNIAQKPLKSSKINFEIVHVWSYGYLLRRLREVSEECGIEAKPDDEKLTQQHAHHAEHMMSMRGLSENY